MILLCEECDSLWLTPEQLFAGNIFFPEAPDFMVPTTLIPLYIKGISRWAKRTEILAKGWDVYLES